MHVKYVRSVLLPLWSNVLQRNKTTLIILYFPERDCSTIMQFYYTVASLATRLNDSAFDSQQGRDFSPLQDVQPGCWAHPTSYSVEREDGQFFHALLGLGVRGAKPLLPRVSSWLWCFINNRTTTSYSGMFRHCPCRHQSWNMQQHVQLDVPVDSIAVPTAVGATTHIVASVSPQHHNWYHVAILSVAALLTLHSTVVTMYLPYHLLWH